MQQNNNKLNKLDEESASDININTVCKNTFFFELQGETHILIAWK